MSIRGVLLIFVTILTAICSRFVSAIVYSLPPKEHGLIGRNIQLIVPKGNKLSLENFATQYEMGLSNMLEANPGTDPFLPKGGSLLTIPRQLILPTAPRHGIIINSAEMRLYYYPIDSNTVVVLPIGIGQLGKDTPLNWITSVYRKKDGPTWTPTAQIRKEYATNGRKLPQVFAAGPENPMGPYALYIGHLYAIHGTNVNFGIGLRVSHGCVRLRNNDIKYLFENVPVGTRVQFINEPVKISIEKGNVYYLEVHATLSTNEEERHSTTPVPVKLSMLIKTRLLHANIQKHIVDATITSRTGIPVRLN